MSIVHTMTEGGQIWTHRIRMLKQVLKIAVGLSLLVWVICFSYAMKKLPSLVYQASWYHVQAQYFATAARDKMEMDLAIWEQISHQRLKSTKVRTDQVLHYTEPYFNYLLATGEANIEKTGWITALLD